MRYVTALLILCLAALLGGPARAAAPAAVIDYHARTLPNGLQLYTVRDASRPKVSVQLWYRVGSKDDPPGRAGLAHLFEHLMFLSRSGAPPGYLDELTEGGGGESNASTTRDFTEFHDTVAPAALERALWAEASRMASFEISQADLDSERRVVEREGRESASDDAQPHTLSWTASDGGVDLQLAGDTTIGTSADLRRVSLADAHAFHDRYYRPDNAALVVVGDFDPAKLDEWVDRYFGRISRGLAPAPAIGSAAETARATTAAAGGGRGGAVVLLFPAPAAVASADAAALQVVDALLTGLEGSIGAQALVQRGLAADVFSQADLRQRAGVFYFGAVRDDGASLDALEAGLRRVLATLRRAPVDAGALLAAKNQLLADAYEQRETVEGVGEEIGRAVTLTGDASYVNAGLAALARVRAADIQRVALRYLADDKAVAVRLGAGRGAAHAWTHAVRDDAPQALQAARLTPRGASPPPLPEPPAGVAPPPRLAPPPILQTVLPNGLRVAAVKVGHLPVATAVLVLPAGAAQGRPGERELNRLAADEAVFGCRRSISETAMAFDRLGLSATVRADEASARVTVSGLSASLPAGLRLVADCLRAPTPSSKRLRTLRSALDAFDPQPREDVDLVADRAFERLVFGGATRAAAGAAGRKAEARARLMDRRRRLLRPEGAVLVLAGDLDPGGALRRAAALFGGWTAGAVSGPPAAPVAPSHARILVADAPGYSLALVAVGGRVPGYADALRPALELADSTLAGSYTARLSERLRIRSGLTYDVSSRIAWRPDAGLFTARAAVDPAAAPETARLMAREIGDFAAGGPTRGELAKHKALLEGSVADAAETTDGMANLLADEAARSAPLGEAFEDARRIAATDAAEVRAAATRLAQPGNLRIVIVADVRRLPPAFVRTLAPGDVVEASALVDGR